MITVKMNILGKDRELRASEGQTGATYFYMVSGRDRVETGINHSMTLEEWEAKRKSLEKKEVRKIQFAGFNGEKMTLEVERDSFDKHDHIWVVSPEGKRLSYLHIDDHSISSHDGTEKGEGFLYNFKTGSLDRV